MPAIATATTGSTETTRPGNTAAESGCRQVRTAFEETIRPHSVDDVDDAEALLETIRAELTEPIAVALAPTTDTAFTPELRQLILAEASARHSEARAFRQALTREARQLSDAADVVSQVTGWLDADREKPVAAMDFESLENRHETLAAYRERCDELVRCRQAFLDETTTSGGDAVVRHRRLVPYLYSELSVHHPVLATAAELDAACRDHQQTVREHLVWSG